MLMFDLIVSQGRIADKTARTIEGAARTAKVLKARYGATSQSVGEFSPPASDDWTASLPQAQGTLKGLSQAITASIHDSNLPVMLANTCSASLASLPVVAKEYPHAVVLWIDAHGDFNTPETTDSGYLGGMVLAAGCGLWDSGHGSGLNPKQVVLVGARDIDQTERELLRDASVRVISPEDATPSTVLEAINGKQVWIHIDWDVLEPGFVPADYKVTGGMMPKQLIAILEAISPEQLVGFELAEFQAPTDEASIEDALSNILDIVTPLLDKTWNCLKKEFAGVVVDIGG